MGDSEHHPGVQPAHEVTITTPFYMGIYCVTREQGDPVVPEAKRWLQNRAGAGTAKGEREADALQFAAHDEAMTFCKRVSLQTGQKVRLPTEAEWEYACRAGTKTTWFFGNDRNLLGEYAWCGLKGQEKGLHAVGLKKPNPWGLYDMYGNFPQHVSDFYAEYSSRKEVDPVGPPTGADWIGKKVTVCRGGVGDPGTSGSRIPGRPDTAAGFRVVVEWPLVVAKESTAVFKFVSIGRGKHLEKPAFIASATSMPSGGSAQIVVPNKPYCEKGPDSIEAIYSAFKAAAEGDLLKVKYSQLPGGPMVAMSAEPYKLRLGEDKPGVYLFCKMSNEKIAGIDRPVLVAQKYLQESTFVLPVRQVAGRYEPDAQIMAIINGLEDGQAVEVQVDGRALRSIRPYKPSN